jgi:guanosine-3',5'-bis(diphosphate) 3'-pyrophosphohydrolase
MDIETILEQMGEKTAGNGAQLVRHAYEIAMVAHDGQARASGESYIQHPLAVAGILADLRLDPATIAAALLHDVVEDTPITLDDLRREFGEEIAKLVDGVTKLGTIDQITELRRRNLEEEQAENLRKIFLAMVDDVRVVLIKLADRLHNMRTLAALPEDKRRRIAQETLEIYAPLANRLGIWQVKWELEDLAFRYLEPETYKEIAGLIDERREDRMKWLAKVKEQLTERLREEGIEAEISARPKHIYSIYRKMKRKGVEFDQIYDVRAVRIIVSTVSECYAALGVVHSLWRPIPREFDDFIATPKDNMYRSLHTAVVGPDGKPLEVQIRTHEMHRTAEYGIAAHWRYKEGQSKRDIDFENKIAWLRQIMEWRQEVTDARQFVDSLKTDVFQDRVYTFTPQGDVIDLPAGSTPVDFAYHVHTEIGHRCRGARVNGKLVNLDTPLQNGDQVEIITAKRGGPSRDWLNPHLGFVKTSRAREKIRQWFRRQNRDQNIQLGREILDRELKRLSVESQSYDTIAQLFGYKDTDDFLAAIGYGDINGQQIATKVLTSERERAEQAVLETITERQQPAMSVTGVNMLGTSGLLTKLARCCNPLPGDPVIGYITRGSGVTIHRQDCPNVARLRDTERLIAVDWGTTQKQTYSVMIRVKAFNRGGLLRDIAAIVADEGIDLSSALAMTGEKGNIATVTATLEIASVAQLSRVLANIERVPNVIEAKRILSST